MLIYVELQIWKIVCLEIAENIMSQKQKSYKMHLLLRIGALDAIVHW